MYFSAGFTAFIFFIFLLLLYKPKGFTSFVNTERTVSQYLTHTLAPELYNGLQSDQAFDVNIVDAGLNQAFFYLGWPKKFGPITCFSPAVIFNPQRIVILDKIRFAGLDFAVTVVIRPFFDTAGLLNLDIEMIKTGALKTTFPAKIIARRLYQKKVSSQPQPLPDWQTALAAALFDNKPFTPVFFIDDRKVLLEKINVEKSVLKIRLLPLETKN